MRTQQGAESSVSGHVDVDDCARKQKYKYWKLKKTCDIYKKTRRSLGMWAEAE